MRRTDAAGAWPRDPRSVLQTRTDPRRYDARNQPDALQSENRVLRAEVARLRVENRRLRAALAAQVTGAAAPGPPNGSHEITAGTSLGPRPNRRVHR
jgi:hypothetical protein